MIRDKGVEVVRFVDEWCRSLPEWWASRCGCKRSCEADDLWPHLGAEEREMLLDSGFTVVDGWTLVRDGSSLVLFPWPKRLYRRVWQA